MEPKSDETKSGEQPLREPIQHIAGAHQLLKTLNEKFGAIHPELNEAITKLGTRSECPDGKYRRNVLSIRSRGEWWESPIKMRVCAPSSHLACDGK